MKAGLLDHVTPRWRMTVNAARSVVIPAVLTSIVGVCAALAACAPVTRPPSAAPSATEPTAASAASPVVNPRLFGRIVRVEPGGRSIAIDLYQMFGLPEAEDAARQDGALGPTETLRDPYYARNLKSRRILAVDPAATVTVLGHGPDGNTKPLAVGLAEFASSWRTGAASGRWSDAMYYWFQIRGDQVVWIEAQYVP